MNPNLQITTNNSTSYNQQSLLPSPPADLEVKTAAKFETIVPSIHDPHPTIRLENLPRSLQPAVAGLRILEINLHEIFFVQTHCDLVELSSLLPTQDFDTIILHFSIILGLIRAANQISEKLGSTGSSMEFHLKEMLIVVLPDLKENLLKNWQKIQKEAQASAETMKSGQKASVEKLTVQVCEAFHYLSTLIDSKEDGFKILKTSLLHIEQPEKPLKDTNEWLELMLRYTTATKQWFSMHPGFWKANDRPEGSMDYSNRLDMIHKFIQRRMKLKAYSVKTLSQLRTSLTPYLVKVGNIHTRALSLHDNPMMEHLTDSIGFGKRSTQKLAKSMGLEEISSLMLQTLAKSCYPDVIRMDSKRMLCLDAIQCAAIADIMKKTNSTMDARVLHHIIDEAREVVNFFKEQEASFSSWGVFSVGTHRFSYADMGVHISNILKILDEMTDSPDRYSTAILYTLFDLKGSVCNNLVQGVEACLQDLNKTYQKLQKIQSEGHAIDPQLIDSVLATIQSAVNMMDMLSGKSDSLNLLINRLIEGKRVPPKKSTTQSSNKRKKGRKTKKGKSKAARKAVRPPSTPKEKEPVSPTLEIEEKNTEVKSVAPIEKVIELEEEPEEIVSIEVASQRLITATVKLQKSLSEVADEDSLSEDQRQIRNVKWRQLCKELKNAGFVLKRSSGSHHQYQHPNAREVGVATVPVNSKNCLSTGVVKNVRSQIDRARRNTDQ